jgi:Fe-S-cluster containining protein
MEYDGYVSVYWADLHKMQRVLQISLEIIAEKYLDIRNYEFTIWNENLEDTGKKQIMPTLVLYSDPDKDCIFLYEKEGLKLCEIYEGRPLQCELFPFWTMIMNNQLMFEHTMEYCKGIRSLTNLPLTTDHDKHFFSESKIQELLCQERSLEYEYYNQMKEVSYDIKQIYPFLTESCD